jgi:uracil-DNA glycosylase
MAKHDYQAMCKLHDDIVGCTKCGSKYGTGPFCFRPRAQKVMLITACPSIQAMFRPLTSIRFFRIIMAALFGPNVSEEMLDAIHEQIYWTHWQKCYSETAFQKKDFDKLSNECAKQYIEREIDTLQPELIIMLGESVIQKFLAHKNMREKGASWESLDNSVAYYTLPCKNRQYEVIGSGFPQTGVEPHFAEMRERLSKFKDFKNIVSVEPIRQPSASNSSLSGLEVGLNFENKALSISSRYDEADGELSIIERRWLDEVVRPNHRRAQILNELWFFMEDQIHTFNMTVFNRKDNLGLIWGDIDNWYAHNRRLVPARDQKTVNEYLGISSELLSVFTKYIIHLLQELNEDIRWPSGDALTPSYIDKFEKRLEFIQKVRHQFVHAGGYLSARERMKLEEYTELPWIRLYTNMVYLNKDAEHEIIRTHEDFLALMRMVSKYATGQQEMS